MKKNYKTPFAPYSRWMMNEYLLKKMVQILLFNKEREIFSIFSFLCSLRIFKKINFELWHKRI